ncbi:colicin immunity domain-containing protein [Thauera sinica]|uniref:Colicin immunity domain-containing protein n=1 Tax=Thauera sinica TaxID=2665146 RepID=A0ABW1AKZ7_9RHOO|nr:colicin immunity domain-containing protein [Thauera sp. K11]ATE62068.1 colicin immunity protein [Thauera sp. K11]
MSSILLEFAKSFVADRLSGKVFSEAYIELWKIERDKNLLQEDAPLLSECLSSIFCAADMYCEDAISREEHEFDSDQLKAEISRLIRKFELD